MFVYQNMLCMLLAQLCNLELSLIAFVVLQCKSIRFLLPMTFLLFPLINSHKYRSVDVMHWSQFTELSRYKQLSKRSTMCFFRTVVPRINFCFSQPASQLGPNIRPPANTIWWTDSRLIVCAHWAKGRKNGFVNVD